MNTADSRVELSFDVAGSAVLPDWARRRAMDRLGGRLAHGVLTVASSGERSQLMNRQEARARLADLVRDAVAPPARARVPTKPSRAARERRLDGQAPPLPDQAGPELRRWPARVTHPARGRARRPVTVWEP